MINLITAQEVINLAFTDRNFLPGKILDSQIKVAQEGFMLPALGDNLYTLLTTAVPSGSNAILVNDYLKPALAWFVRYVILPEIGVHASNTGVQVVTPNGSQTASDKQAGTLREQAKANGDILLGVALRYIEQNPQLYPAFCYSETTRSSTRVLCGVVFSKRRKTANSNASSGVTPILMTGVVRMIEDVRRIASPSDKDIVICAENNGMYEFTIDSSAVDDNDITLKPNTTDTGRWLKIKELQMVNF